MDALTALVTGAGRGIGRATAELLARQGYAVVVAARTSRELDLVCSGIAAEGGRALAVVMDVTDLRSVEEGVHAALEWTGGKLDVLVNNAGVFDMAPFPELSPATWYRFLAVNLNGPFHVTLMAWKGLERAAAPHVVNIASVAAKQGFPGNVAYCTTKYGLRGFGDALRHDLAAIDGRLTTVYPGQTDTTIWDTIPGEWDRPSMSRPEDVAQVIHQALTAPPEADVDDLDV
ncbi:MAG: SDR family oxidoreductase [Planctomycetota bacterium]